MWLVAIMVDNTDTSIITECLLDSISIYHYRMSIGQNVCWTVQDNVYKSVSGKAEGKRERKGYSELEREHRLHLRRDTSALIQLTAILQEYRHALNKLFYSRKCKRIRFLYAIIRHCQLTQLRKWTTLSPKQTKIPSKPKKKKTHMLAILGQQLAAL